MSLEETIVDVTEERTAKYESILGKYDSIQAEISRPERAKV